MKSHMINKHNFKLCHICEVTFSGVEQLKKHLDNDHLRSTFSKHRPSGPMLSISRFVRPSVCLFVRVFTFEVPFNGLFAPTSRSRMSNIFRDSESWGKVMERSGLRFEHFCLLILP